MDEPGRTISFGYPNNAAERRARHRANLLCNRGGEAPRCGTGGEFGGILGRLEPSWASWSVIWEAAERPFNRFLEVS